MSNAVIPRQQGDSFQARFFWLKASRLFHPSSPISKIEWEASNSLGFDDVVVHYSAPQIDASNNIVVDKFQVKFHVDHKQGFNTLSLIDPLFIGTVSQTILGRLHKLYVANPAGSKSARYNIVNTWGIDHSDPLRHYIGNGGAIRLGKLFDGSGDKSESGRIRKIWRDHLSISDDSILKEIIRPLRILHSYADLSGIVEQLNSNLLLAGLKPIDPTQRASKYAELIQQLHSDGQIVFTKDDLLTICKQEGLYTGAVVFAKDEHIIGVRSFTRGAENLELDVNDILCLLHFFTGRFINEEDEWQKVFPMVQAFADKALLTKKPLLIHLDTHLSVAFCMGYCLNTKYGAGMALIQKTGKGPVRWSPEPDKMQTAKTDNWAIEETAISDEHFDIVVAVSVTHLVKTEAIAFVANSISTATRIIHATINPKPSPTSIQDANHIILAATELVTKIKAELVNGGRKGTVHLIMAAPNAFAFFLGQQSKMLGKIVLYEYDFENTRSGSYHPAISLPTM